jgi:hypothetical protein
MRHVQSIASEVANAAKAVADAKCAVEKASEELENCCEDPRTLLFVAQLGFVWFLRKTGNVPAALDVFEEL